MYGLYGKKMKEEKMQIILYTSVRLDMYIFFAYTTHLNLKKRIISLKERPFKSLSLVHS